MILTNDNDFSFLENDVLEMAVTSVIGDRKTQEDCCGFKANTQTLLACVCDGMGGYNGGRAAGQKATEILLQGFENGHIEDPTAFLKAQIVKADAAVVSLQRTLENAPNAGCTAVSVYIKNRLLYWSAVGDSRLYVQRKKECIQITKDQNYRTVLLEQRAVGDITETEFEKGQARGDALINFLGIGNLDLIDHNKEPLKLKSGDRLLICTDGLYRLLSDDEIADIIVTNNDVRAELQAMESAAQKKATEKQMRRDNMTVMLIKIK